jgi:hypothetical protein
MSPELIGWAAGGAVVWLVWIVVAARWFPEKPCWLCRGCGWFFAISPVLGMRVRGACWRCGGCGWCERRLSRWLSRW